jgi:hypothetical protein
MAAKRGTEKVPVDTLRVYAFSGGMNTSGSARDIGINEASLIENFEFDDLDNLVTRNGISFTFPAVSGSSTSIFSFNTDSAFIGILATQSTNLNSYDINGNITGITGGLTLPADTRWYWKSLNNVAVGVNGTTGSNNPVQVVGPAPGTASHLAAAPDGRFIEEWNSRLVIAHVTNLSRIQFSDLGSATSWNTGGLTNPVQGIILDVAPGDGDRITALFAFKERLFVFKRKKIYVVRVTALPETDPNNWEVAEYAKNIGCINQSTVREVFDDVVFLSEGGLASLAAAELTGDFASAIISSKISEIQRIIKDAPEHSITAYALTDRSQYWLAVDGNASPTGSNILWVMDYKQIKTKGIRWGTFSGGIFPSAIELYNGTPPAAGIKQSIYLLAINTGGIGVNTAITRYQPNIPVEQRKFSDVITSTISKPIISKLHTKGFDTDTDEIRKLFQQWYLRFNVLSNKASFKISYEMDDPLEPIVNYIFDAYGLGFNREKLVRQAFKTDVQRKSVFSRFFITVGGGLNEGASIKNFGIRHASLTERRSESMLVTTTLRNVAFAIDRNKNVIGNVGGGQDLLYNFLIPFDSLKTDGDYIEIHSGGIVANNDNNKQMLLQVNGDPVTGVGGTSITGFGPDDFDGAAGRENWSVFTRIMRATATSVHTLSSLGVGQFFADGAGTFSVTNGLMKPESRILTVPNLNLNNLTLQILGLGTADNDIVHRQTVVLLNQQ